MVHRKIFTYIMTYSHSDLPMRFIRLKSPFVAQFFAFHPADEVMVAADRQNRRQQNGAKLQHGKADPYALT